MSNEIRLAFAHPSERAAASAPSQFLDRISVRDHIVEVDIGAFQKERGRTQRVCFNIVVEVQPITGPIDDDVDRILSYDRVTEAIHWALAEERLNLLETLAQRIADKILIEPQAVRVFVRIEKLDRGPGALGVEIVRAGQPDLPRKAEGDDRPHPVLVYLDAEAVTSVNLSKWLDQLVARKRPVVLCVPHPSETPPHSDAALAQRRIELLAIEQNAWVLAGRDPRCVVVATRTELDWAMKNGQISVWAPSKIVLDAVEGPKGDPRDAAHLAVWFADAIGAEQLVVVGHDLPTGAHVPIQLVHPESQTI